MIEAALIPNGSLCLQRNMNIVLGYRILRYLSWEDLKYRRTAHKTFIFILLTDDSCHLIAAELKRPGRAKSRDLTVPVPVADDSRLPWYTHAYRDAHARAHTRTHIHAHFRIIMVDDKYTTNYSIQHHEKNGCNYLISEIFSKKSNILISIDYLLSSIKCSRTNL